MINIKTRKKAFSLVELSIVILIIGILISAIVKGSKIYQDIKITSARSVTNSSIVNSISGLALWLETVMENSVNGNDLNSKIEYDEFVASWNDNRIANSLQKINLAQDQLSDDQPIYIKNGIGGLPTIRFDGINDRLITKNTPLRAGDDDYTLIAVWKAKNNQQTGRVILSQDNKSSNKMAGIYIRSASEVGFAGYYCDKLTNISSELSRENIVIIAVDNNVTNNISTYFNSNNPDIGAVSGTACASGAQNLNLSDYEFDVGSAVERQFFAGDISEVIIFDRKLNEKEVRSINSYLSQKYSIKIN